MQLMLDIGVPQENKRSQLLMSVLLYFPGIDHCFYTPLQPGVNLWAARCEGATVICGADSQRAGWP
jgi:hypothetical protein